MSILNVESIYKSDDRIYVTANVEDVVVIFNQTLYDPAEYGPALCEASFYLGDDTLPEDEQELIQYLEDLDLDWQLVDYYLT
jgi:hypothetical protein